MTKEFVDGDLNAPCRQFVCFKCLELGFVHQGCLRRALDFFMSVADHEILESICLADVVKL